MVTVVEDQFSQVVTKDPVNKDQHINPTHKSWEGKITTYFHGSVVPSITHCEVKGLLRRSFEKIVNHGTFSLSDDECLRYRILKN